MFFKDGALEANLVDLIGIEFLRVFEPKVYHSLPDHVGVLLGKQTPPGLRDEKKQILNEINEILELADVTRKEGVKKILAELFPAVEWILLSYSHGIGFEDGWLRDLRVCHPNMFGRYFSLAVPAGDISQASVNQMLDRVEDRESLREALVTTYSNARLPQALSWLEAHASEISIRNPVSLVTALFDVGDLLVDEENGLLGPGTDLTAYRTIDKLLKRDEWADRTGEILLQAISETTGVYYPLELVARESRRSEAERRLSKGMLDGEHLARARQLCAMKLEFLAQNGGLRERRLGSYLYRWKDMAGDDPPKKCSENLVGTPDGALRLLRGFTSMVSAMTSGTVFPKVRCVINLMNVEPFVSVDRLIDVLRPIMEADPLPEWALGYAVEIVAFKEAVRAREEGRGDDPFG